MFTNYCTLPTIYNTNEPCLRNHEKKASIAAQLQKQLCELVAPKMNRKRPIITFYFHLLFNSIPHYTFFYIYLCRQSKFYIYPYLNKQTRGVVWLKEPTQIQKIPNRPKTHDSPDTFTYTINENCLLQPCHVQGNIYTRIYSLRIHILTIHR